MSTKEPESREEDEKQESAKRAHQDEDEVPAGLARLFGGSLKQAAPYLDAAYVVVGALLGFGFVGWLVDRYFGTGPIWLTVGLLLGAGVGLYSLARVVLWRP